MSCTYKFKDKKYSRSEILMEIEKGIISPSYVSEQKARKIVRDLLGMDDTQIEFINGLIEGKAIGRLLTDGKILLSNLASESTVYHEAFHKVYRGAISSADRLAVLKEMKSRKNWKELIEPYREQYGNNEDLLIEEYLADEFGNYMLNNEDYKTSNLLQRIFRSLLNFLKNLGILRTTPIKDLYRNIQEGRFAKSKFTDGYVQADSIIINNVKFSQAEFAALVENIHLVQMQALINQGLVDSFIAGKSIKINPVGVASAVLNNLQESYKESDELAYYIIEEYKLSRKGLPNTYFEELDGLSGERLDKIDKYVSIAEDLLDTPREQSTILKGYDMLKKALGLVTRFVEKDVDITDSDEVIPKDDDETPVVDVSDNMGPMSGSNNENLDKSAFELDPNDGMSAKLKILLSSIVNENERVPLGMKRTYDWVYFASFLNNHLAGIPATNEDMFGKLMELTDHPYYGKGIAQLIDLLGGVEYTGDNPSIINMRIKFISKFAMTKNDFYLTIFKGENIYDMSTNTNTVEDKIRKDLNSKLNYAVAQESSPEVWLNKVQSLKDSLGSKDNPEKLRELAELLGADTVLEATRDNPELLFDATKNLLNIAEQMVNHRLDIQQILTEAYIKKHGKSTEFGIGGYTNKILELIRDSGQTVELSTFNAEGKKVYIVSLPTYQSQVTDGINYAKSKGNNIFNYLPQLNTIQGKASQFLKRINDYGNKIVLGLNDGIKEDRQNKKQHLSEVSEQTLMVDYLNMLMLRRTGNKTRYPIYQAVKHSDRSNLFTYKIEGLGLLVQDTVDTKRNTLDVFENYLRMEVDKLKQFNQAGVGKDIQYYNKLSYKNSIFGQMVDSNGKTKEIIGEDLFKKLIDNYDTNKSEALDRIWIAIQEQVKTDKNFATEWGLMAPVGNYGKPVGIGDDVWNDWRGDIASKNTEDIADKILELYTINSIIGYIEGSLIFTGDTNLYKSATDAFKRFSVYSSTGDLAVTGKMTQDFIKNTEAKMPITINGKTFYYNELEYSNDPDFVSSISFAEEDYPVDEVFLDAMQAKSNTTLLEVFTNIGLSNAEELAKLHSDRLKDAYSKVNEPDGATWVNLFQWRRMKIQWGQWSEEHEELFKKELEILNGKDEFIVPNGVSAKVYLNEFLGLAETMKAQYAGPYWNDTTRTSQIGVQGVAKSGFYPLLPSQIRGTMLEKKNKYMLEKGIGMSHVNSARKIGQRIVIDNEGKPLNTPNFIDGLPQLYTTEGKLNLDLPLDKMVQFMEAKYLKHQTKIHNYDKEKIINSTQSYKETISNLFHTGTPIDYKGETPFMELTKEQKMQSSQLYKDVVDYAENMSGRIKESIEELEKEMGYSNGNYETIAPMVKVLKEALAQRGATSNVLEALDLFENATNKIIDLLPNKNRIEPVMYSLVRNKVLNQKRAGNSVPQVPSTLWDSVNSTRKVHSNGKVYASSDLQYHVDKGYADVYLPIPMNWVDGLMDAYGTRDLIKLVDNINRDIENNNFSKFDEDILFIKGLRIPNQQLASNDIFRVKKFLVPTNIAMVVVPSIITTKVGSDFDIDKLNIYMSNVVFMDGRLTRVTKQLIEEIKSDKKEYVNYSEFHSILDSLKSLGIEVPFFEDKKLTDKVKKLLEFVKTLKPDTNIKKLLLPTIVEQLNGMLDIAGTNIKKLEKLSIDNELLDIERRIMLNPLNYTNLMKPTDDRQWKGKEKNEGKGILKEMGLEPKEIANFNIYTSTTNIEKTRENISSKGGVGIVAVHITGHVNGQMYNLRINLNGYDLPEFVVDASLGKIINENGEFITDLLSGMLTSQVDAVKDPYAKSLGLVPQTLNIAAYLLKRGVSHEKIIRFLSEPIIRDYLKNQQIWESPLYSETGLTYQKAKELSLSKNNEVPAALTMKKYSNQPKALEKLELFQNIVEHAKMHSKMIKAMSPDTFKPKSIGEVNKMNDTILLSTVGTEATPPIVLDFENRNNNSIVPILESHDAVTREYKDLYGQFYMELQPFMEGRMERMKNGIAQISYGEAYEKNMKKLYEDFVDYLVQNYTDTFKKYSYASLMTGDNSVPKQIIEQRNKSNEFRLFEMLVPQTRQSEFGDEKLDNARMVDINDNPFNIESYINEVKELAENDPEFIDRLIAFTIYQSGMSNSVYTIDKILPAEYKHKLMQEAVNNVKDRNFNISDFATKFQMANPNMLKRKPKNIKEDVIFEYFKAGQKVGKDYRTLVQDKSGKLFYPLGAAGFKIYNVEPIPFTGVFTEVKNVDSFDDYTAQLSNFPAVNQPQQNTISDNIKREIDKIYPNWITKKENEVRLAAEFASIALLYQEESPIKDRIAVGKEALKTIMEISNGKNPFVGTTIEEQLPNMFYAYISGKLAQEDILEKDLYANIFKTNNISTIFGSKNINPDETLNPCKK